MTSFARTRGGALEEKGVERCVSEERTSSSIFLFGVFYNSTVEEKGKGGRSAKEKREGPASRPTASGPHTTQGESSFSFQIGYFSFFFPNVFFFSFFFVSLSLSMASHNTLLVSLSLSLSRLVESIQSAGLAAPVRTSLFHPPPSLLFPSRIYLFLSRLASVCCKFSNLVDFARIPIGLNIEDKHFRFDPLDGVVRD